MPSRLLLATALVGSAGAADLTEAMDRVAMVLDVEGTCSGFVLDATTVLTAGHCVQNGRDYRVALYANTDRETRFSATAWLAVDDPRGDLAFLRVHGHLPYASFPVVGAPQAGSRVWAIGYPGGRQPLNQRPRHGAEITIGDTVSSLTREPGDPHKLLFRPTVGRIAPGSSGGPILTTLPSGGLGLTAIVRGNVWREDRADDKHGFGYTLSPWQRALALGPAAPATRIVVPTTPRASLAVLPGRCLDRARDGYQVRPGCDAHASVRVETGNLPHRATYDVRILDDHGQVLGIGTTQLDGGEGIHDTLLSLGGLEVLAGVTTVSLQVTAQGDPSVEASLGPIELAGTVELAEVDWEADGSLVVTLNAPLFEGDAELELRTDGAAADEVWRLHFENPRHRFRLAGIRPEDVPHDGLDLALRSGTTELIWTKAIKRP